MCGLSSGASRQSRAVSQARLDKHASVDRRLQERLAARFDKANRSGRS